MEVFDETELTWEDKNRKNLVTVTVSLIDYPQVSSFSFELQVYIFKACEYQKIE